MAIDDGLCKPYLVKDKVPKLKRKKGLVGWTYEDNFEFSSISAWSDSPQGLFITLLKHKNDLGKFKGKKVRITIEEL